MHPDFAPRAPCGPGGDSFRRSPSTAVLAARTTVPLAASSPLLAARPTSEAASGRGGGTTTGTVPTLSSLPQNGPHGDQQGSSSYASSTDRLWGRFFILALDSPSTSELRSVFSRACGDAFAGDGPVSSALRGPVFGASCDAAAKTTVLITSEIWTAVDAMGAVVAEFPQRLNQLLLKETSALSPSPSRAENCRRETAADIELMACRLDYFTLGRLLRPLVLGRTGGISTPTAVQRFFCHEVCAYIVHLCRFPEKGDASKYDKKNLPSFSHS